MSPTRCHSQWTHTFDSAAPPRLKSPLIRSRFAKKAWVYALTASNLVLSARTMARSAASRACVPPSERGRARARALYSSAAQAGSVAATASMSRASCTASAPGTSPRRKRAHETPARNRAAVARSVSLCGSPLSVECAFGPLRKGLHAAEAIDPVKDPPRQPGEALPVARIEKQLGCLPQVVRLNQQFRPLARRIAMQHRVAQAGGLECPVEKSGGDSVRFTAARELLGGELSNGQQQHKPRLSVYSLAISAQQSVVEKRRQILERGRGRVLRRTPTRSRRASRHRRRH